MRRTIQKTFRMLAGAAAAAALSLFGCTQELYTPQAITGPVAARFIADITPAARVNQKGTDWTDGDCIGITGAGYTNVPYVRESGQFVPLRIRPSISMIPKRRPSMPTIRISLTAER